MERKEAIEIVRKLYNESLFMQKDKEAMVTLIPELKESEDEKMREMAIKAVHAPEAQSCIKSWGVNPDDVIAWLEKQGEQKPDLNEEAMENIFQELKEREDKKWRKWLIGHLEGYINITDDKYAEVCKKAITWLEKQNL